MPKFNDLSFIENNIYNAKFNKALRNLQKLEKNEIKDSQHNLSILILKGRLLNYEENYKEAIKVGDLALKLSIELGDSDNQVNSLIIKSCCVFLGDLKASVDLITEAEKILLSLYEKPHVDSPRLFSDLLIMKFIILRYTGDLKESFKTANSWITLYEGNSKRIDQSRVYTQLSESYLYDGNADKALSYANKSLEIQTTLKNKIGIASSLYFIGQSYFVKGEIEQCLKYCKEAVAIHEISFLVKLEALHMIGAVFKEKGDLNRALRHYNRAANLAQKERYTEKLASILLAIGTIYRMRGESDIATNFLSRSLKICREINSLYGIAASIFYLMLIYLEKDLFKEAEALLPELGEITNQTQSIQWKNLYKLGKALVLKKPKRLKFRSEAESIFREIINDRINLTPQLRLLTIINLCDLLLEELVITNNDEIFDEITPLINLLLQIAQSNNSFLWLAETKLLQAKLSLIKMDIRKARKLMIQAQTIAEMHGFNLLAIKISNDHDSLLDQSSLWYEIFESEAPYSERIKLASIDRLISQMQDKESIKTSKIIDEEPILLLIMSKDGISHFTLSFKEHWDYESLFSSFLSAFNSFSSEIFSKNIDRIKVGENKILINPIKSFLACYVIRGQSYPAQKKLYAFSREIEQNPEILKALTRSAETGRELELNDPQMLGKLVKKVFPYHN